MSDATMPGSLLLEKRIYIITAIMNANAPVPDRPIRNIDIALLRAFAAVAQSGSMTSAARVINVTQGAISQQVKRLEALLGKPLFDRSGQGLALTVDGERLLLHAQKLIALNDEVFGLMTAPEFTGVVRLGLPYDIVSPFAAPILRSFANAYPKVRVELEMAASEDLKKALIARKIDLTLTTETDTPKGAERLMRDQLVWVGGLNGEAYQQKPLPVILCNENCMFRPAMLDALEKVGRDWHLTNAMRNMDATLAMLQADLGVTALLESTVPGVARVLGKGDGLPEMSDFAINLYVAQGSANGAANELAQHIRDHFSMWRRSQYKQAS